MKKLLILLLLVFVIILVKLLYRPGGSGNDSSGSGSGSTIIWASIGDATYLNPVLASDSSSGDIDGLVFNGLVKYNKDLVLTGDLAEKWTVSDDKLEITFHLRKDVRWHDGEPFDAGDVVFTYNAITSSSTRTPYSSRYNRVNRVYAPDPYTVKVVYSKPYSPALESWGMGIIPEHIYRGTDINTNPYNRSPVGTGPYRFVSWKTDDRIVQSANTDYFAGEPSIKRVIYRIIPDYSVQFMELKKGTIDWMNPTPDQWENEVSHDEFLEEFNRYRYPSFAYTYMAFNLTSSLFKDVRVRRAISYAVDKKKIIDSVLLGLGSAATGPYPPNSWAYDPKVKDYGYYPEKAYNLLKGAGWVKNSKTGILEKDGVPFKFTLMTNQGNTTRKLTCEIIQNQLGKLGIDVKVRIQEWSSFIHQYVDKRQFDAIVLGWNLAVDPDQYSIWHSSQIGEGKYNFAGYSNPEVDRLLEKGRSVFDMEKRKKIYRRVHSILHDELPYLFLYVQDSRHVIHKRFRNIRQEKAGITYNFIKWYVPEESRRY